MQIDKQAIKAQMAEYLKIPVNRLDDKTPLNNIIPDSFMMVELLIQLQEENGMRLEQADIEHVSTISDLTDLIATRVALSSAASAQQ